MKTKQLRSALICIALASMIVLSVARLASAATFHWAKADTTRREFPAHSGHYWVEKSEWDLSSRNNNGDPVTNLKSYSGSIAGWLAWGNSFLWISLGQGGSTTNPDKTGDQDDFDGDGIVNSGDPDKDNDGLNDWTDSDSQWSVCVTATGATVPKNETQYPTDWTGQVDSDGDGIADWLDTDIDGDGLLNIDDPTPNGDGAHLPGSGPSGEQSMFLTLYIYPYLRVMIYGGISLAIIIAIISSVLPKKQLVVRRI